MAGRAQTHDTQQKAANTPAEQWTSGRDNNNTNNNLHSSNNSNNNANNNSNNINLMSKSSRLLSLNNRTNNKMNGQLKDQIIVIY